MSFINFDDWVEAARESDISAEALRRGAVLKRQGGELVGQCPACGGEDRFSINLQKRIFHCRGAGVGGDVIDMVGYLDGRDFVGACEAINGAPPPGRDGAESEAERQAREARQIERSRHAAERQAAREAEAESYRDAEIRRALDIWQEGRPLAGTHAAAYLGARGIRHLHGLRLRFVDQVGYFVKPALAKGFVRIGVFPAMVAAIADDAVRFRGVHITHLDPDRPAKATILHPETGDPQPAKKVRGSVHGGVIRLAGPVEPERLISGEGIETTASVRDAMIDAGRDIGAVGFWAGISLGNMGGSATEQVPHPLGLTRTDKAGRERIVKVAGPVPDLTKPGIALPDSVVSACILVDRDSDPAATEFATRRCAARWVKPGRAVQRAWAAPGGDFNDMRRPSAGSEGVAADG